MRSIINRAGFTLVEMLVALAIAGILFFVALPGYQYAVIKSTRAAARGALLDIVSRRSSILLTTSAMLQRSKTSACRRSITSTPRASPSIDNLPPTSSVFNFWKDVTLACRRHR